MKFKTLCLVDSMSYIKSNPYQHQLFECLNKNSEMTTMDLNDIKSINQDFQNCDFAISCLKLRSLIQNLDSVFRLVGDKKLCVYDQDPWESFRDGSVYKDSYFKISDKLNAKFYVTTKWWADYIDSMDGLSCSFVRMWTLPQYCEYKINYLERNVDYGFIGGLRPSRKMIINDLDRLGVAVKIIPSGKSHREYLDVLSNMKVYVHNEVDMENSYLNGVPLDTWGMGMWVKDIEANGRGCFTVRNYKDDFHSYYDDKIKTAFTFDHVKEVPEILNFIKNLKDDDRDQMIFDSVERIRERDEWSVSALKILSGGI